MNIQTMPTHSRRKIYHWPRVAKNGIVLGSSDRSKHFIMKKIFSPLRLTATLIVLFLMADAFAQTSSATFEDKTLSPYFMIGNDSVSLEQFPLREALGEVNIAGNIANVTVSQVYENKGKRAIEATYVFPASTRAAVYALQFTIGDRTVVAKIREKEQARYEYQQAINEGRTAGLLEQHRPNVFQMTLGNIMPGDVIRVELKYTELLIPEKGIYEFIYPTVVGPRYSNPAHGQTGEQWTANPYLQQGNPATYGFDIRTKISTAWPLKEIRCSSHDVNINYSNRNEAVISLKNGGTEGGNRDYVLKYRLAGEELEAGVLLFRGEKENYFMAMVEGPVQARIDQIPPREYIFIVDVSGSMHGFPLDISKKLMKDLISGLRPADKFNVILFAGVASQWAEKSKSANEQNINEAIAFISKQQGGGGTELISALKTALAIPVSEGYARTFVIATDGYVSVEKQAFALINESLNKANFFAFGIGSSVNRYIIEGLAKVGRGLPFVILDQGSAAKTADRFRAYISSPVLSQVKVRFEGLDAYDVEPLSIADVFAGRPVCIIGKFRGEPKGKLILEGFAGSGAYRKELPLEQAQLSAGNAALPYLWARERISRLDDYSEGDANKSEVTELGLNYNLLTRYTSFVAIDSEIRNTEGQPIPVVQPLPLPQGVSNMALNGATTYGWTSPTSPGVQGVQIQSYSLSVREVVVEKVEEEPVEEIFMVAGEQPTFIGGESAMQEFFRNNMRYPVAAVNSKISGKVYVEFVVKSDGTVSEIKIKRGIGGGCNEEAIRLVKLSSGKWNPGKQNGKAVSVRMILPVEFRLN
jgi:Ca-activated chloride channel homolog